eukprot:1776614-Pyramimonas_sp.AAC.1
MEQDWDGQALHTLTEEKYCMSWDIISRRRSGMVNMFPETWASYSSPVRVFLKEVYNRTYM